MRFPDGQTVGQSWNASVTSDGTTVTARNVELQRQPGRRRQHDASASSAVARHERRPHPELRGDDGEEMS